MPETSYTTVQGDLFDVIARKVWPGDGRPELLAHHLQQANPDYQGVTIFSAGVELAVPDIPAPTAAVPLPPWKAD